MSIQLAESSKFESETLSQQVDRLSQAIQHLGLDQASDKSLYLTSMSFDSYRTFSRLSEENDENLYAQGIYKSLEEFLLELDRTCMCKEDFRSMELRKAAVHSEDQAEIVVQVGLDELELIKMDLKLLGNGKSEIQMQADGKKIKFILNKQQLVWENKKSISSSLEQVSEIENQLFKQDLNEMMNSAFTEEFYFEKKNTFDIGSSYSAVKTKNLKENKLMSNLEWQAFEISNLKSDYLAKIALVSDNLRDINNLRNSLKSKELQLFNKRALFLKDIENLEQHKKLLETLRGANRKYLQIIKTLSGDPNKQLLCDSKNQIERDMLILEQEISSLEEIQSTDKSGVTQTKIDRLKTKQSNLRTLRVINASTERSNLVAARLKCTSRTQTPNSLKESVNCNTFTKNKENIPVHRASSEKVSQNSLESFHSYIKMQENRLIEKEQELNQREALLSQAWLNTNQDSDIVQAVRTEQRNLKILRKNLEKRQKNLEAESLLQLAKVQEYSKLERNFSNSVSTIAKFIDEQAVLETRLQFFFDFLKSVTCPTL